jgi:hypothetical protein
MKGRIGQAVGGVTVLAVVFAIANPAAQAPAPEGKLKAAFVSKFPQFVEWPAPLVERDIPLTLCVAMPDPFGPDLDELVSDQSLNGHAMVVRRLDLEASLNGCHVLFLPSAAAGAARHLLRKAASIPILTIGDDRRFLDEGGIIGLRMVGGRVRFEVSVAAARRAGLKLSSQLLQLALSVRGATE